jgi:hypothetical protein
MDSGRLQRKREKQKGRRQRRLVRAEAKEELCMPWRFAAARDSKAFLPTINLIFFSSSVEKCEMVAASVIAVFACCSSRSCVWSLGKPTWRRRSWSKRCSAIIRPVAHVRDALALVPWLAPLTGAYDPNTTQSPMMILLSILIVDLKYKRENNARVQHQPSRNQTP